MSGEITCDSPNELLDRWDGNVTLNTKNKYVYNVGYYFIFIFYLNEILNRLKSLLLRGCTLRNTEFCFGFVLYTGPESKIMMNAKKPPAKVSNVQRKMNKMLYSVSCSVTFSISNVGFRILILLDLTLRNPFNGMEEKQFSSAYISWTYNLSWIWNFHNPIPHLLSCIFSSNSHKFVRGLRDHKDRTSKAN